jgi:hypothetical protein
MNKAVNSLLTKSIAWMLLIQVVNISIDPIDVLPVVDSFGQISAQEDLSINDIESIYELVSEQYLGVDVPEQDEDDESGFVKVIDFYFSDNPIKLKEKYIEQQVSFSSHEQRFLSIVLDHVPPPPKIG